VTLAFAGRRLTRGLRFRLTLSYILLFLLVLAAVGLVFRGVLISIQRQQLASILEEEWGEVKGFLRIENNAPRWVYDPADAEQAAIVNRLRTSPFLLRDSAGRTLEASPGFPSLPNAGERVGESMARVRADPAGGQWMVRESQLASGPERYTVTLGRSLAESDAVVDRFTRDYFIFVPAGLVAVAIAGWWFAGGALRPVEEVTKAAQAVTGSNLSLRIPERGAGDELDHLIRTFNGMVARLETSFGQMRQFSTDVSHELRTPLTVIRGHLEVALMTAKTPEQYQEAISTALGDVERLSRIVRALLQLSQAESGQLALTRLPQNASEIVLELMEGLGITAEDLGISVYSGVEPGIQLNVDRVQFERLLTNLVSNAVKFTPAGGRVVVQLVRRDTHADLIVEDTGRGIAPEHLPHLFDRFYRVPGAEAEKGLGLGLSFVSWIVKAHDGVIHVESEPGKGTRIAVSIPLPDAAPAGPEAERY
jgi:heavy metal sensor kinase